VTDPGGGDHPGPIPRRGHYTEEARRKRLEWARKTSGAPLEWLERTRIDARWLAGNIENFVGTVPIPVGLAGPLLLDGRAAAGWIAAPMATTEGALVASASRGARAISRCGPVSVRVLRQRMARAPLFEFADMETASRFATFALDRFQALRDEVRAVSSHAVLLEVAPVQIGRDVHLRFVYETADAAGQNMTTACTWRAAGWLRSEAIAAGLVAEAFFLDGNSSGDKKVTWANMLQTRGARVTADCRLDAGALRDILKTDAEAMVRGHARAQLGGLLSGMVGYNINVTNVIAAMFAATGQDIACVHESGLGVLSVQPDGTDGIYASLLLPGLAVGTVGGGTALPAQRDYLAMIGCEREGGGERLAEIITGFALALELSTCAAMVGGQFADAHERLGRNKPVDWFTREDVDAALLQPMLARSLELPGLVVTRVTEREDDMESGSVSEYASHAAAQKFVGLLPLTVDWRDATADPGPASARLEVVVKSKPLDAEVALAMNKVASVCGGDVAAAFARWRGRVGFEGSHVRELGVYRAATGGLRAVMPRLYGIYADPEREAYVLLLEDIAATGAVMLNTADDARGWTTARIDAALTGIAGAHAVWLGREQELQAQEWLGPVPNTASALEMAELWTAIFQYAVRAFPKWVDDGTVELIEPALAEIGSWWPELEAMPRTLVHGDFSPRNVALRAADESLVAYDWELATLHVPQRDLAEMLAFALTPDATADQVEHHVSLHREQLARSSGVALDPVLWRRGYRLALRDFIMSRLSLFLVAHAVRSYQFLHHVVPTVRRLVDIEIAHEAGAGG
jgi:hydroxymethylglutaryl-CoA reductase (NADPH)